jgi:hypothetical protein
MKKQQLVKITTILPFDAKYIKVGKSRNKLWNLMDSEGNLISETWFENIEKNNDGSIKTITEKKEEIKFTSVKSISIYNEVIKFVPATVMNIVDVDSIERYENCGYVARAYFFGKRVYIKADGRIFDEDDNELRIMFNSVDTIRLNNALVKFNKKIHYDFDSTIYHSDYSDLHKAHKTMWCFYWLNEDYRVRVGFDKPIIMDGIKKWTDDLKIRILVNGTPKNVIDELVKKWGSNFYATETGDDYNYSWSFKKNQLELIIDTLNNID